ncbi:MAG: helix-turn-helix transcriptional regulator [Deltaproteobacteria bacterium]|nr:helix-turn-helix transcriptional regulator [Deltaproteobacteria bacterium]
MARALVSSSYAAAERGELDVARSRLRGAAPESRMDRAWSCAAHALSAESSAELETVIATLGTIASQAEGGAVALPTALACAHAATIAAVTFDASLARVVQTQLASMTNADDLTACALVGARGWLAWMAGERIEDTTLAAAEKCARSAELATLLVQLGVLRALVAEACGDGAAMMSIARRVSRMASSDGVPRAECLAHLVLARARRTAHHPHLAIRILAALASVAPWELAGWIALEARLAGDLTLTAEGAGLTPSEAIAEDVSAAIDAARRGARMDFERHTEAAVSRASSVHVVARELALLAAAIDVTRPVPEALAAWSEGDAVLAPPAVHGLGVRVIDESDDVGEAAVLGAPNARGRRLLGLGALLALGPDVLFHRRSRMRQGRVETLLAVLASAGPEGLEDARVFEKTYELVYQPTVHRGVFDVLLTRTRAAAEGFGDVVRRQGRIVLTLSRPVLLPDPRASARAHDRLLRALARSGRASADEVAKQTGLSVRAAQEALKSLSEGGACVADRRGRQLVYAVEDTTFSEATELLARRRRAGA